MASHDNISPLCGLYIKLVFIWNSDILRRWLIPVPLLPLLDEETKQQYRDAFERHSRVKMDVENSGIVDAQLEGPKSVIWDPKTSRASLMNYDNLVVLVI